MQKIRKGGFKTKAAAKKYYDNLVSKYTAGLLTGRKEKVNFKEYLRNFINNRYSKEQKNVHTPSPYKAANYVAQPLYDLFSDEINVDEIDKSTILSFIAHRRDNDEVKNSTINRSLALLKTCLFNAVDDEIITKNPMKKVRMLKENNKRDRVLSYDEEKEFMEVAPKHIIPIVRFVLNTGLRKNEVLCLKWDNVNIPGKRATLINTKNGENFTFPLNNTAIRILNSQRIKNVSFNSEYVFNNNGNQIKSIRTAFDNARDEANLIDFHFHDLRRTFATRLWNKGVDIYTIQKLLNHKDLQTTIRYLGYRPDNGLNAVNLLDKIENTENEINDTVMTPEELNA
jgi:integrase